MRRQRGQAAFEWVIMLAVVLVISIATIRYIAKQTAPIWSGVASQLQ